ncbi:MAG: hypothetical protein HZA54_14920 [Planctomycetes bacterium]|nr:hypothetical protein [Planctomycetota bacterium]
MTPPAPAAPAPATVSAGATGATGATRRADCWAVALLLALTACAAAAAWTRCGDAFVDCGRDLVTAVRLADGELLYRDVQYNYGPFSPYLRAALVKLCGPQLDLFRAVGAAWLGAFVLLAYALLRRFLDPPPALLLAASLLVLCGVAQYTNAGGYNYLLPYAAPAVDASVLGLAGLLCLLTRGLRLSPRRAAAAGAVAGLLVLTKVEFAAALLAAGALRLVLERNGRGSAAFLGAATLVAAPPLLAFGAACGFDVLVFGNLFPRGVITTGGSMSFPLELAGLARPGESLTAIATALGLHAALLLVAVVAARLAPPAAGARGAVPLLVALAAAAALGARLDSGIAFRDLPLLDLAVLLLAARRAWRTPASDAPDLAALAAYALLASARTLFNLGAYWYGFYVLPPSFLLFGVLLFRALPAAPWLRHRLPFLALPSPARTTYRVALAAGLVACVLVHGEVSLRRLRLKTHRIAGRAGELATEPGVGMILSAVLRHLEAHARPGDALLVFPEGAMLNLLSGLRHSSYHGSFTITEIPAPGQGARVIADLESARTRFVVWFPPPPDFTEPCRFGADYAEPLLRHVRERYREVANFASRTDDAERREIFRAIVLERR